MFLQIASSVLIELVFVRQVWCHAFTLVSQTQCCYNTSHNAHSGGALDRPQRATVGAQPCVQDLSHADGVWCDRSLNSSPGKTEAFIFTRTQMLSLIQKCGLRVFYCDCYNHSSCPDWIIVVFLTVMLQIPACKSRFASQMWGFWISSKQLQKEKMKHCFPDATWNVKKTLLDISRYLLFVNYFCIPEL